MTATKSQIIINGPLIRDKSYTKAFKAVVKKHKIKVKTTFLSPKDVDVAAIYSKDFDCLLINENTSYEATVIALNRISEMDFIPRDKDYEFVLRSTTDGNTL